MTIENLIIFCTAQIIGLILILTRKKFRTVPNFFLMLVLINISIHYAYYYLFYKGFLPPNSNWPFLVVPFATMAPLNVYYYAMSVLYGKLRFTKNSWLHLIPYVVIALIFLFYINTATNKHFLIFLAKEILISLYLIYPILIVKMIGNFYQVKSFSLSIFSYNKSKTSLIRLLCLMMTLHFCFLIFKNNIPLFIDGLSRSLDIINLCFFMVLGYAISYVIISEPKSLQLASEKVGLGGFKKYSKSKLTRSMAEENAICMNGIMEKDKPYLNSDFKLTNFSQLCGIPSYEISETLNGLTNQSFNDYLNNYRIEEFKKISKLPKYRNFTILALAFESGFKSKATFNSAFKKITGKTPSEYLKESK